MQPQISACTRTWTGLRYWQFGIHNSSKIKQSLFPNAELDYWTCTVRWRAVLPWRHSCYSDHAGDSRPISNFYSQLVGSYMANLCAKNYRYLSCFSKVMPTYRRGPAFLKHSVHFLKESLSYSFHALKNVEWPLPKNVQVKCFSLQMLLGLIGTRKRRESRSDVSGRSALVDSGRSGLSNLIVSRGRVIIQTVSGGRMS